MDEIITTERKVSPFFQLILIIISMFSITLIFYMRYHVFHSHDEAPVFSTISPETYKQFGEFPDNIRVGLYINDFQTFDITKNEFIFSGVIWFEYYPGIISLDTLTKFSFDKATILYMSLPDTLMVTGEKLLTRYNIRIQFNSALDYRDFPLDNHTLHLVFNHQHISPNEFLFSCGTREFIIKADTSVYGWKQINQQVTPGYTKAVIDPYDPNKTFYYPLVSFAVDYERSGIRYMLSIVLPLLLIFYLVIFSVSLDPAAQIGVTTGGITATLAYRFVIENLSPQVGYFMLSDYIFFLVLCAICFVFLLNLIDTYGFHISLFSKRIMLILIHAMVIGANAYLLFFWIR